MVEQQPQQSMIKPYPYTKNEEQKLSIERTQSPDFMKWILDSKEEIEELKMVFKGYELNSKGEWVKEYNEQIEPKTIGWFIMQIRPYLTKTVTLAYQTDEQIAYKTFEFETKAILYLYVHNDEFGYGHDYTRRTNHIMLMTNLFNLTLTRARNALQLKYLTENIQRSEVFTIKPQEKKAWWKIWG